MAKLLQSLIPVQIQVGKAEYRERTSNLAVKTATEIKTSTQRTLFGGTDSPTFADPLGGPGQVTGSPVTCNLTFAHKKPVNSDEAGAQLAMMQALAKRVYIAALDEIGGVPNLSVVEKGLPLDIANQAGNGVTIGHDM